MELTVRRTAALALAGFALLVIARPPRPSGPTYYQERDRTSSAADRARRAQRATRDTLFAVENSLWSRQLRDSVLRTLAGTPASGQDRAFIDPRIPTATRAHIEAVYAATRARMSAGRMALPIFVVLDPGTGSRLGTTLWAENAAGPAPACATILRVRVSLEAMRDTRQMSTEVQRVVPPHFPQPAHFGLCGFEAMFGAPSAEVRRWLQERGFQPIASGYDPTRTPRAPRYLDDLVVPYFNFLDNGATGLELRACAAGRSEHCLNAVASVTERQGEGPVGQITNVAYFRWYGWGWNGSPDLMNALAASMGAESFGRLWRGNSSPPDAYRHLTGVPIDTLARRVLVGDAPPLRVGASLSLASVITSLLIAAVFAGLATLAHPRRRRA